MSFLRMNTTIMCGMLLKIAIELKPFLVTMRYVRFELSDHAFPLNPDDSIDLADVQITLVQAFHNSGLLLPKLVLGSVPEGHYFHSADHVVLYYPLIMVLWSAIPL